MGSELDKLLGKKPKEKCPYFENKACSYSREEKLAAACRALLAGINKTIENNLHLADGDNCTLIDLKIGLANAEKAAKGE